MLPFRDGGDERLDAVVHQAGGQLDRGARVPPPPSPGRSSAHSISLSWGARSWPPPRRCRPREVVLWCPEAGDVWCIARRCAVLRALRQLRVEPPRRAESEEGEPEGSEMSQFITGRTD
jgi:hypothetical protein